MPELQISISKHGHRHSNHYCSSFLFTFACISRSCRIYPIVSTGRCFVFPNFNPIQSYVIFQQPQPMFLGCNYYTPSSSMSRLKSTLSFPGSLPVIALFPPPFFSYLYHFWHTLATCPFFSLSYSISVPLKPPLAAQSLLLVRTKWYFPKRM